MHMRMTGRARGMGLLGVAVLALACANSAVEVGLATSQKQWWRDGVCYEIFVRSFVDADGDGIGDLRSLTSRLDYVRMGRSGRS